MLDELVTLLKAQYPLIYVVTPEEERAEQWIVQAAQETRAVQRVFTWTVTHGLLEYGHPRHASQH
ncbi:MAG: AAA family ATPase, partial [Gloeomargarita sp. GMQP_bins_69]